MSRLRCVIRMARRRRPDPRRRDPGQRRGAAAGAVRSDQAELRQAPAAAAGARRRLGRTCSARTTSGATSYARLLYGGRISLDAGDERRRAGGGGRRRGGARRPVCSAAGWTTSSCACRRRAAGVSRHHARDRDRGGGGDQPGPRSCRCWRSPAGCSTRGPCGRTCSRSASSTTSRRPARWAPATSASSLLHILPNTLAPILVIGSSQFATMVLLESGLSFLGMGVQPPQPSWGAMLAEGRDYLSNAWWLATVPGIGDLARRARAPTSSATGSGTCSIPTSGPDRPGPGAAASSPPPPVPLGRLTGVPRRPSARQGGRRFDSDAGRLCRMSPPDGGERS